MRNCESAGKTFGDDWAPRVIRIRYSMISFGVTASRIATTHTLEHIKACLIELDTARFASSVLFEEFLMFVDIDQPKSAIEFALWFHDCVYEMGKGQNEEKSADLATKALSEAEVHLPTADTVRDLIQVTKDHHVGMTNPFESAVMIDIDLTILGQPVEVFDRYEEQIKKEFDDRILQEFGSVQEGWFRKGRTRFIRGFLERERIFNLPHFRRKYEAQARKNLLRSYDRWR